MSSVDLQLISVVFLDRWLKRRDLAKFIFGELFLIGSTFEETIVSRPRIIAVCFTIDPDLGSEPGAAWGVVKTLMKVADVDVLVPSHKYERLHRWQHENGDDRIHFVEVEPPTSSALVWTYSELPKVAFLSYWLWLRAAKKVGLALERQREYAACIHVAYGSYWLPSPVVDFKASSIWGSVGGATRTPMAMWPYLGVKGVVGELLKFMLVRLLSCLPATRHTWYAADFRLAETENTRRALPKSLQADTEIVNRAALQNVPERPAGVERKPYILFPSRLQPRKGPRLAIHALAHADRNVKLVFVADGMERKALENLANQLGVSDQIEFRGWVERHEMFRMVSEAAAVLFTGMREEGGCALAEAMQVGTPVIVLGVGGAKLLADTNLDPSRVSIVAPARGGATAREMGRKMTHFVNELHPAIDGFLDRASVERHLLDVVARACQKSGRPLSKEATHHQPAAALIESNALN